MRKIVSILVLLSLLFGAFGIPAADARGGRTEDCTPGSNDPDCK
jgi:hypothetical protein